MPSRGKSNLTVKKNKLVSFLRNSLRILFLIIFLHWILWITTYAKSTSYYEAIKDEKISKHYEKSDKYNNKGLLGDEYKEKNIEEIEDDILNQIEQKKGLTKDEKIRVWKQEKLPDLKQLDSEIENLQKKENPTKEEKEELAKKQEEYKKKLGGAKEETIENIEKQLEKNELNITELDDNRSLAQKIFYDPLKFFLVDPFNKSSKFLGLHNQLVLEIIFKLVIVEIVLILIYLETTKFWENSEKTRDPSLSVEERDQLNEEALSLFKYVIFNGFMTILFVIFLSFHPAFFDRTSKLFQNGTDWKTGWYTWVIPLFISLFLSGISTEFLRHGRLLTKQELKVYVAKSWFINLLFALGLLAFMRWVGMYSIGSHLLSVLGGLVKFVINTIRVKFFGHQEHFPHRSTQTTHGSRRS